MNKKLLSIIALILAMCFVLASCGEPDEVVTEPHTHTYETGDAWSCDATMHWHASVCDKTKECKTARTDYEGHIDDNYDGKCDVCNYTGDHTHTFVSEWTYDETHHWNKADCYHAVVNNKAEHTPNILGICTVCGAIASDPAINEVEDAIEVGASQQGNVIAGAVNNNGHEISYEYRPGYLFVDNGFSNYYYSATEDGVFAVAVSGSDVEQLSLATVYNLLGPEISSTILSYETDYPFYGTIDLLEVLYEMASVDDANADFTEKVEDGKYMFSFGFYSQNYGLHVVEVEFELDDEYYTVKTVNVVSKIYTGDSIYEEELEDGTKVYRVVEPEDGAEAIVPDETVVLTIEQICEKPEEPNPYDPDAVIMQDFYLVNDSTGDLIENNTITIYTSEETVIKFANWAPTTAMMEFTSVSFAGEGVNPSAIVDGNDAYNMGIHGSYTVGNDYFTLKTNKAPSGTVFTVEITVNGIADTYTVNVLTPVPNAIIAGERGEHYADFDGDGIATDPTGHAAIEEITEITVEEGDTKYIGASLDKNIGEITITVDGEAANDAYLDRGQCIDADFNYINAFFINVSYLTVGEHTVTFTSTANTSLTATITVTVTESTVSGGEGVDGTGTDADPFLITAGGNYTANVKAEGTLYYIFTAPADGTYTISFEGNNFWVQLGTHNFMLLMDQLLPDFANEKEYTLNEGDVLYFTIETYYGDAEEIDFSITASGGSTGGDVTSIGGTYIGTDLWEASPLTVTIDEDAGTVTFDYNHPMFGPSSAVADYEIVEGAVVLYDPATGEVLPVQAAAITLTDGVPTACVYNGTEYTLTAEGGEGGEGEEGGITGSGTESDPYIITGAGSVMIAADMYMPVFVQISAGVTVSLDCAAQFYHESDSWTALGYTITPTEDGLYLIFADTMAGAMGQLTATIGGSEGGEGDEGDITGSGTEFDPYIITGAGSVMIAADMYMPVFVQISAGVTVSLDCAAQFYHESDSWTALGYTITPTEDGLYLIFADTMAGAMGQLTATTGGSEGGEGGDDNVTSESLAMDNTEITPGEFCYTFTAIEDGSLYIELFGAVMGPVDVTYSVNGGDVFTLNTNTNDTLSLVAGDVVTINVVAEGYSTLYAEWIVGGETEEDPFASLKEELTYNVSGNFDEFYFNFDWHYETDAPAIFVHTSDYSTMDYYSYTFSDNGDGSYTVILTAIGNDTFGLVDKTVVITPNEYVDWLISIDGVNESGDPFKDSLSDVVNGKFDGYTMSFTTSAEDGSYVVNVMDAEYNEEFFDYTLTDNGDGSFTVVLTAKTTDTFGLVGKTVVITPNEYVDWVISIDGVDEAGDPLKDSLTYSLGGDFDGFSLQFSTDNDENYAIFVNDANWEVMEYFTYELTDNGDGSFTVVLTAETTDTFGLTGKTVVITPDSSNYEGWKISIDGVDEIVY